MIPILCQNDETKIGFLKDCIRAEVTEERNGCYELVLDYPVTGEYFSNLALDCFIKAKPNQNAENQYFKIYWISKPINGIVTAKGEHISYSLSHYPIKTVNLGATTGQAAINGVLSESSNSLKQPHKFTVGTCDIETLSDFTASACSARAALGGIEGSVLDKFGGEYEFDNYIVNLWKNRGADKGVKIAYRKNMTEMKLDTTLENSYTGIFPYCTGDNDELIMLDEGSIHVQNDSGIAERVLLLDCSSMFTDGEEKNKANLRKHANEYLESNDINSIEGSMSVSMIDLSKSVNYKNLSMLETVSLCDTVKVEHQNLNVTIKMKVIKTVFDVLGEKYKSLNLGTAKVDFADTIKQLESTAQKAKETVIKSESKLIKEYKQAIEDATKAITGASGGYVILNPPKNPSELLILCDSPILSTAKKLWRFNSAGLSYTSNGYEGPYGISLLADGKLVINSLTAHTISASLIRTGMLTSADGNSFFNLDSGRIEVANNNFKTVIDDGLLFQTDITTGIETGGLTPFTRSDGKVLQGVFCSANSKVDGIVFVQQNTDSTVSPMAQFTRDMIRLHLPVETYDNIKTNTAYRDIFAGVAHFRGTKFNGETVQNVRVDFGCGGREKRSSMALQMRYATSSSILARMDFYRSAYVDYQVAIVGQKDSTTSNVLELGKKLWFHGNIVCDDIEASSTESVKTNIQSTDSVLSLFEAEKSEVFSYNRLRTEKVYGDYVLDDSGDFVPQGSEVENIVIDEATSYGFVIGDNYKTPAEILTADGEHVNIYSIAALSWKAIQELYTQLKTAQAEIATLKQQTGG